MAHHNVFVVTNVEVDLFNNKKAFDFEENLTNKEALNFFKG